MKIIIPVAGIGTKLRPHTHTQPKALVPVAGKPILAHIVDSLVSSGFDDFIFIIGYLGDKIESFISEKYPKIKASFVVQEPREGTGHAVWLANQFIGNKEEILIVLGDTIVDFDLKSIINSPNSLLGVKRVDDPRNFGVAEVDQDGFIIKLSEKPNIPKSNMALVGVYLIKESDRLMEVLDHMVKNKQKTRDEYSLTEGIMKMIEKGTKVATFQVGNWYDCGGKTNLLETNAVLLKRFSDTKKVYDYVNTIIIEPVSIGNDCDISDSIIGPNVSIGERTIIRSSIIRNSIIGSFSQLETAVLHQSVVGSDAYLKGLSQSLNIGDSTEIDFS
ncbi:MAG: NTP transferase domain-containing protein [Bacteroidetes bacterium]|nr:NTP transferase domain-containing protein [Bacteroidota bacterium]